jgi:hypothetical protein
MESSDTAFWAIIGLLLVAALVLWFLYRHRRTAKLRDRFGEDEYDRTLETRGSRGKAEADLIEREKRVHKLELRPLGPAERERFTGDWHRARERFVDDPGEAVRDADRVLGQVMAGRGFPVKDFDERHETLTVDHPEVARHYRAGHNLAMKQEAGTATTEELRQAMIHYEALFDELVQDQGEAAREGVSRPAQRA